MILILMGVSGTGKTTVGKVLAERLGWKFEDADDYHPASNVAKMRQGIPLNDEDRQPWLRALARMIKLTDSEHCNIILACSALKRDYRDRLRQDLNSVRLVLLDGPPDLIRRRLKARTGHYMDPHLLSSQYETLEAPDPSEGIIRVDVTPSPEAIAAEVRNRLGI